MKYEVKMNDWILGLDLIIEADDFDLISEIQMAVEAIVDSFHESISEAENEAEEAEETEESEEESIDFVEDDADDVTIEGTQGTVVIINTK
jgi:hypothetical protein